MPAKPRRGVTFVQLLAGAAVLNVFGHAIGLATNPKFRPNPDANATTRARELRNPVNRWRATRASEQCPTVSQLVQDKEIDSASKADDPWNRPYRIICGEDDVTVISDGPDRTPGTPDDIRIPRDQPMPARGASS